MAVQRQPNSAHLSGTKIWISTAQVANKMLILTRTTPLEQVRRKSEGLTLFYTDLDRSRVEVREIPKMGRHAVDSNMVFISVDAIPSGNAAGKESFDVPIVCDLRHTLKSHKGRERSCKRAFPSQVCLPPAVIGGRAPSRVF